MRKKESYDMMQTKEIYGLIDRKKSEYDQKKFSYLERWEMISQENDYHLVYVALVVV